MTDFIPVNSIVSESLNSSDQYEFIGNGGYYYDFYQLANLQPGAPVTVSFSSNNFDTWLELYNADTGQLIGYDNDGGTGTNSQLTFVPQVGDQYLVGVSSFASNSTGFYEVEVFS